MFFCCYLLIVVFRLLGVAFLTLLERKILGFGNKRFGPNFVRWYGLLQPLADFLKLLRRFYFFLDFVDLFFWFLFPFWGLFLYLVVFYFLNMGGSFFFFFLVLCFFFVFILCWCICLSLGVEQEGESLELLLEYVLLCRWFLMRLVMYLCFLFVWCLFFLMIMFIVLVMGLLIFGSLVFFFYFFDLLFVWQNWVVRLLIF